MLIFCVYSVDERNCYHCTYYTFCAYQCGLLMSYNKFCVIILEHCYLTVLCDNSCYADIKYSENYFMLLFGVVCVL